MTATMEKLFMYMQEDLPILEEKLGLIKDKAEKEAQSLLPLSESHSNKEAEGGLSLGQLQQKLRQERETQEAAKSGTVREEHLKRKLTKEQKEHEPMLLDAQNQITAMQGSLEAVTQVAQTRHEQLVTLTNIFLPHKQDPTGGAGSYVRDLHETLKREIDRLAGEQAKHQQYEVTLKGDLIAARTRGDTPGLESPEDEQKREANKLAITTRKTEIEDLLRKAVTLQTQEEADRAAADNILRTSKITTNHLQEAHTRAMQITEKLNTLYAEIESTRRNIKQVLHAATEKKLGETLAVVKQQAERITNITEAALSFIQESEAARQKIDAQIEQADPPGEVSLDNTVFLEINTQMTASQIPYNTWSQKIDAHRTAATRIMLTRKASIQTPWEELMANNSRGITASATLAAANTNPSHK